MKETKMAKKDKKSKKIKDKSKGKSKAKKSNDDNDDQPIMISNVRISHPSIFERNVYNGETGKFEATFLIPKDTKHGKKIKKTLDALIEKRVAASSLKKTPKGDKCCLRDGDKADDKPEYADHWTIKASRNKRPSALDGDGDPTTLDDEVIYAGCFVDAVIDIWIQDNKYGKRVNANLYGVKFHKDGEPFTSGLSSEEASDILNGKSDGGKY